MMRIDCCLVQIDGMKNRVLMKRFAVTGFPSIYLLRGGQTWIYESARSISVVSLLLQHCIAPIGFLATAHSPMQYWWWLWWATQLQEQVFTQSYGCLLYIFKQALQ